ncbi:MAG: geranylgeranylglycerol-phosphate geranylgeranyltransferase [Paludibacter sp.]|nr:geranylgeranylglycerol-phosphate geranylgeranyltransferase [Bacteroidales bacterium]MCM1069985.1 geranylgeranylglycerol-phosphate geranylgeranyltransferase [Prevotella sp.]MCM1354737.1 geranylgeranylglycerol-phosphate geranylgeranyltransferase [Bacteroides sp.]MCM1443589.1 geranylgeranylglycerol-phosphate geranylgeranyltransferase [Muribaculum sp.]MCM1482664.1 geranylgeranylglycerol-phosphate geranylgeranyltransferase [Paludibacter sp.]
MNRLKSIFRLVRWQNLLFIILIMWLMEKMIAVPILGNAFFGEELPGYVLYMLIAGVVLIAAGGYAINDYFDVRIDAINRPDKQIVTRTIDKPIAMLCHQIMTGMGVLLGCLCALWLHSWSLAFVFLFVPGLLWFYSASYKRQFVIGNLIVALVAGLTPLLIAIANVDLLKHKYADILPYTTLVPDLYTWIGGFALFAFLCTLIREIVKDLQDQPGDRELECHTLPVRLGEGWTKSIVVALILLTCTLLCWLVFCKMPFPHNRSSLTIRYLIFGLLIPFVCEVCLLLAAKIPSDYRSAQLLMKFIMMLGVMYSIVIYMQI